MNRDFEAFEWFVELLGELELQQAQLVSDERFLTIHLYMTSAKVEQEIKCYIDPANVKNMGKKNLLNEVLKNENQNFGLKLIPGRPKFTEVLSFFLKRFFVVRVVPKYLKFFFNKTFKHSVSISRRNSSNMNFTLKYF